MRAFPWFLIVTLALFAVDVRPARACGGTFCDGAAPQPMPVDQTGENILFIDGEDFVEAHIQIQYTGDPQRFAWVIPLPAVPEFSVGSELFFRELLRASVPSYSVTRVADTCATADQNPGWWALFFPFLVTTASAPNADLSAEEGAWLPPPEGPQVVVKKTVGAFDVTVVEGGTAEQVTRWLRDNQFQVPAGSQVLFEQYTNENHLFAAVRLTSGAGINEIHPLVLRYAYGVPCVPLRLTALAATSDMGVRTFFLGNARVVPRNYRHVEVNPLRIDWVNSAPNYQDVVARAADDPESGGHGFVTEYAGPSTVLVTTNFHDTAWRASAFTDDPVRVVDVLENQRLVDCGVEADGSCTFFHPLVRGLLEEFLPPPAGFTEYAFWRDLEGNSARIDRTRWNADAFRDAFSTRISLPAQHAEDLARNRPYLTRMLTFISPEEMTVDPEFHPRPDLPDVTAARTATLRTRCDNSQVLSVPGFPEVELMTGGGLPEFPASMPWAVTVDEIPREGAITRHADRSNEIAAAVGSWNQSRGDPVDTSRTCACAVLVTTEWPLAGLVAFAMGMMRRKRACR